MTASWLAFTIIAIFGFFALAILWSEWRWQVENERLNEVVKPLPSDWEERL